jgi:cyclohexyl-isocyanide hydratase
LSDIPAEARRLRIAMLIYPGMTLLDMAGPQTLWGSHGDTCLVWERPGPVMTDTAIEVVATHGFADCPTDIDILFVPGGFGTWEVIGHAPALDFLRRVGSGARYVTSVCTGSIILAAAGLLENREAATHWATYPMLEALGVRGRHDRVVFDGNRITGGGVTAGIDFGLAVLAELRGEAAARMTQLMVEYDPAPPFDGGCPERAGPDLTAAVLDMLKEDVQQRALPAIQAAIAAGRTTG